MTARQISRRLELLLAAAGLTLLAAVVFAPIVLHGGLLGDDWIFRALYLSEGGDGFGEALAALDDQPRLGRRPLQLAWQAMLQSVFGGHAGAALALTVGFAVVMCWALYAVLRELDLERLHSAVIASSVLVFPAADSTKLWIAAGYYSLSISFVLTGLWAALRAFRLDGARRYGCHALSVALFAAGIATNELTVAAVAGAVAVYLFRADREAALKRWAVDLGVIAIAALTFSGSRETTPATDWPEKARLVIREGAALFADRALPLGLPKAVLGLLMVAVIGLAVVVLHRLAGDDTRRAPLRRWLGAAAFGAGILVAGYLVLVPAVPGYHPAGQGIENRVNALATLGMVLVAYSLVVLTVLLALHKWRRRTLIAPVAAVLGFAIALSNLAVLRDHQDNYVESADRREAILGQLESTVHPPPPEGSVIFYFGNAEQISVEPGIPVFDYPFDLAGALQIMWESYDLLAYPQGRLIEFTCFPDGLTAQGSAISKAGGTNAVGVLYSAPLFFYYSSSGELKRITDGRSCREAVNAGRI